jgi:hypothetical protein
MKSTTITTTIQDRLKPESRRPAHTPTRSSSPTRPQQIDEKQDDCESAASLELLEETGQNITENKTF